MAKPKNMKHDWSTADWSKPNVVLAREFAAETSTVSKARRRFAPKTVRPKGVAAKKIAVAPPKRGFDWSTVDWKEKNRDIAESLGASYSTVAAARGRHAPHSTRSQPREDAKFWAVVDWRKTDAEIARATGYLISTVKARRSTHGADTVKKRGPYKDAEARRERLLAVRNSDNSFATAAARKSPLAGKGTENVHAKQWVLISPDDRVFRARNLNQFIRDNPDLFAAEDVIWKRTGGKRGTGGEWCNASAGLGNVRAGRSQTWKGWSLAR